MLSCTFEQPFPFDGTPSRAKSQDSRVRYWYLWTLHFPSEKIDGTFSCSMFKPSLTPSLLLFPSFLLLPLPSVLSFVIVMARQEIEVQENRKKKRGWRFCQSEVGVRQTCQSHWGRRTQYNHGNVFALCCFRFTQIFTYLQQSFQRKLWLEMQNFCWTKLFWMLFYQELCFELRRWLLVLPGVINHILLERYSRRNWATGYFWNTSRSALLGNFYSLVHFQCWSKERKNNHLKAASYKSHSTIHFCSIFNAALFLTQSLSDFYQ